MKSLRSIWTKTLLVLNTLIFIFCFEGFSKNIQVYVSAKGSDTNNGTKHSPVKTLGKAQTLIRSLRQSSVSEDVTIFVEDGVYPLENPVLFTGEDSRVVIQSSGKSKPIFTGSRELKNWKVLTDPEKLNALSPEAKGKVYVANVKEAGIVDFGNPVEPGKRPELFCNGQLQTLARWPDQGFTKAGLVKGETELPPTFLKKRGTKEGIFGYIDKRQNRWANEPEVCLGGYWYWDWSDEFQKVRKVDTLSQTLNLAEPYHRYGYKDSLRYFGVNLFCEIDQPGEWYLNRTDGRLYWYPPVGVDPMKAVVSLSVFNDPYMLEMKDCSLVTLKGLTFQESRGSAVLISGGANCLIKDCRFERFGRDGIHVDGGLAHGISGCLIRTLGFQGIEMKGGDRKTLTPANHFIENTVVEYFSLFKRTYEPAVYLDGCGMRVSNNRFRHSSSSAIRLEGNDFTIEYNEISEVVNESDDQGGLDMWYDPSYRGVKIRFNRWSDIFGGTHSGAAGVRLDDMISGVIIYGNIFERCGVKLFGGVQIHGGKDNLVENNLFYRCNAAVSFSQWDTKRWLSELENPVLKQKMFDAVDIRSSLYQEKYPELKTIRENINVNTIKNNLIVDCKNQFLRSKVQQVFENNRSIENNENSIEHLCSVKFLKSFGLQPIPVEKIGPKNNPWIVR
jgi:hypothetical protein